VGGHLPKWMALMGAGRAPVLFSRSHGLAHIPAAGIPDVPKPCWLGAQASRLLLVPKGRLRVPRAGKMPALPAFTALDWVPDPSCRRTSSY
jgi:hypothetical protein